MSLSSSAAASLQTSDGASPDWHVLLATWLGGMFDGMDSSIFSLVLFPCLSEMLHSSSHQIVALHGSYVIAIYMVGWAIGAIAIGVIADYFGRARTMTISILLYAICTGLCATAHSWQELAFYRFLVGAGIGGEMGVGAVMLSESWPNRSRAFAIGVMASSIGFGYMVTASLNLLLGHHGWRWLFVAGVAPAFLTVYIRAKLKEPEPYQEAKRQRAAALSKSSDARTDYEKRCLKPTILELLEPENFKNTCLMVALASTAIIVWWAVLAWIPSWINKLTGELAVEQRSFAMYFKDTGMILSGFLGSWILAKLGYKKCTILTFLTAFVCTVCMFMTTKTFSNVLLLWILAVGFFCHLPFIILWTYIPELFNARIRSTAFGVTFNIGRFAAAFAALCSGNLINAFNGSYAIAASTVACVYLFGCVAALFMPKTSGTLREDDYLPADVVAAD